MKRISRIVLSCVVLATFSGSVYSQTIADFLGAGVADGNKLAGAYFRPYGEMLGGNLNSGWYNSANVHKLGGFDLTAEVTFAIAPSSAKSYTVPELNNFTVASGSTNIAPTMVGKASERPTLTPKGMANGYANFTLPNGTGFGGLLSPMIQAAVGLPFHTEVMGRFMPKTDLQDFGQVSLWGIGVKHSLKNYIPFVKRVPIWNLSVMTAYTHFDSKMGVAYAGNSGQFVIASDAYTVRLLTGINLPLIAFYTGLGYGNSTSSFDLNGQFTGVPSSAIGGETVNNPLALKYDTGGFDFNIGTRLRLGVIAFHAEYTAGKYNTVTAGIGVNFR